MLYTWNWWVSKNSCCGFELWLQIFDMRITSNYRFVRLKQKIFTRQKKTSKSKPSLNRKDKANPNPNAGGERGIRGSIHQRVFVWLVWVSQRQSKACASKKQWIRRQTRTRRQSTLTQINIPTPWNALGTIEKVSKFVLAVVGVGAWNWWRVNAVNVSLRIKPRKKTNLDDRSSNCHIRTCGFLRVKKSLDWQNTKKKNQFDWPKTAEGAKNSSKEHV